jgi:hypothetical protein
LKFLSGDYFSEKAGDKEPNPLDKANWMQVLLYQLLLSSDPTWPLTKVIQAFDAYSPALQTPILWLLIRFYGYFFDQDLGTDTSQAVQSVVDQLEEQLESFSNTNVYPGEEVIPL